MAGRAERAFPVGLYGLLLGALCWLAVPQVSAPVERALLGAVAWSVQLHLQLTGTPAVAAMPPDHAAVARLQERLQQRIRSSAVAGGRRVVPAGLEPVVARVVAVGCAPGGGRPTELRLDRCYAELAECSPLVTRGENFLGLLCRPGLGIAARDGPADPARVQLLSHPDAPRLPAYLRVGGDRALRFLVEPAGSLDPWPLRTRLWDDPYQASELSRSGQEIRTLEPANARGFQVPSDLLVGRARVWGYQHDGDTLPIGMFVEPATDYRALSHVVLWHGGTLDLREGEAPVLLPAVLMPLPGQGDARFHLHSDVEIPDGAAIVRGGICLGMARGFSLGQGTGTSFAASRRRWSLVLLPDDEAAEPRELLVEVVAGSGTQAWVRCFGDPPVDAGFLFTGGNGPNCPAGLLLGHAAPQEEPGLMRVLLQPPTGVADVFVVRGTH